MISPVMVFGLSTACLLPASATIRLFMVADGGQDDVIEGQTTTVYVPRGGSTMITAWLVDDDQEELVNGFQLVWPKQATPLAGSSGSVVYIDRAGAPSCFTLDPLIFGALCDFDDPATCGGNPEDCFDVDNNNTLLVDQQRPEYLYADIITLPPFYSEGASADPTLIGVIVNQLQPDDGLVIPPGPQYLAQFAVVASSAASGTFQLAYNTVPPGTFLFRPQGPIVPNLQFQPLSIHVTVCGDGHIEGHEACDDANTVDGDGCSQRCEFEPAPLPAVNPAGMVALVVFLLMGIAVVQRRRVS